jgi:hypothetical protein
MLEVNNDIREKCQSTIKRTLDRLPNAIHGLVFVGTKLLSIYSKPKAFELDPNDILMLIIFFRGHFHTASKFDIVIHNNSLEILPSERG